MGVKQVRVGEHDLEISNADKVLFPEDGITKGDLVDYYLRIAEVMLPHISEHPISMQRFPNGIMQPGFYQKEVPDYFPRWIRRLSVQLKEEGGVQDQVVVDQPATLVYLADQACITPHTWLSQAGSLEYPDRLIFDLDPPQDGFDLVRRAARLLREFLEQVGMHPYLMATGSRGLHVVVPLDGRADFEASRRFALDLAQALAANHPDWLTIEVRKDKRQGRLFLDYLRNAYAQTAVAPYALRAKPGAPVAAPLDWDELSSSRLHAQSYNLRNIFRRLARKDDPWREMQSNAQSLEGARHQLQELLE